MAYQKAATLAILCLSALLPNCGGSDPSIEPEPTQEKPAQTVPNCFFYGISCGDMCNRNFECKDVPPAGMECGPGRPSNNPDYPVFYTCL